MKYENSPQDENTWFIEKSGFWRPTPHLGLKSTFYYTEAQTHLDQYIIVDDHSTEIYRNWDHAYTVQSLGKVLKKADLEICEYFSDVTGKPWIADSETMCAVARKNK